MEILTKYCDLCEALQQLDESGYCFGCGKHADNMVVKTQEDWEADYADIMKEYYRKDKLIKKNTKKQLKGLVNVSGLYRWLEENDTWEPLGIFSIEEKPKSATGFPSIDNLIKFIIIDNPNKEDESFMSYELVKNDEYRGQTHYYVWQTTTNMEGDSYSGYLLIPLNNGKVFKVSYTC
jgi:hypothetical protein